MGSSQDRLSPLQRDLLREFFARERRFVLTGGCALAGFHLGHRTSEDLDLFTTPPADLESAGRALAAAAAALGGTLESLKTFPDFQRWVVRRGEESVLVDLVVDRAPIVDPNIEEQNGIRLHSLREIAANKVCAVLGRAEVRDLVDLRAILLHGAELATVLRDAERKDAGVSAATLAWLLDTVRIGKDARLPKGVTPEELDRFRSELVVRLRALALPP